jgi:hypoxanthine-DNA glycosylase
MGELTRCQIDQNNNQFLRLLGSVVGETSLHELPYDDRLIRVLSHGIWDVLDVCHREGSLDSAIRNVQPNGFGSLTEHAPRLKKVRFNGKTTGRFAPVE